MKKTFAFLTDICQHFNEIYLKLQGNNTNVLLIEIIEHFKKKLKVLKKDMDYFMCCQEIRKENISTDFKRFTENINVVLEELNRRFKDFDQIRNTIQMFKNPSICNVSQQPQYLAEEIEKLQCDLEVSHLNEGVEFWKPLSSNNYAQLKEAMLRMLVMFGTTYRCEAGFSMLKQVKNEYK